MKKKMVMSLVGAMVIGSCVSGVSTQAKSSKKVAVTTKTVKSGVKVNTSDFYLTLPKSGWSKKNMVVEGSKNGKDYVYTFYDKANKQKKAGGVVFYIEKTSKNTWRGEDQKVLAKKDGNYYIMFRPTDVEFAKGKKYEAAFNKKAKTISSIQKSMCLKNAYVNKKLGFKVDVPVNLYNKLAENKVYTTKFGSEKGTEQHFSIKVKKASYDIFCIGRINKKMTKKEFGKVAGENRYLGTKGNKTYYMNITEEQTMKYAKEYNALINDYVMKLGTKVHFTK